MSENYLRLTFKQWVGIYYLIMQGASQREMARQAIGAARGATATAPPVID
jgi:hypothetical protein